jgi:hypothetical protein
LIDEPEALLLKGQRKISVARHAWDAHGLGFLVSLILRLFPQPEHQKRKLFRKKVIDSFSAVLYVRCLHSIPP